jgi:gluconokinase
MPPLVIVLMGPAGAGKSTVGARLAAALGWRFEDADTYHSPANLARVARGEGLTDADRAPWLARLASEIQIAVGRGMPMVLACSALRRVYREALVSRTPAASVRFVHLEVRPAELAARLAARTGHVAGPALLASQLLALEEPAPGEGILSLDGERPVADLVEEIRLRCGV